MDRDHDGKLKLDDLKVRALERPLSMTVFGQLTNARVDHFSNLKSPPPRS